jgi:hypothetical protein
VVALIVVSARSPHKRAAVGSNPSRPVTPATRDTDPPCYGDQLFAWLPYSRVNRPLFASVQATVLHSKFVSVLCCNFAQVDSTGGNGKTTGCKFWSNYRQQETIREEQELRWIKHMNAEIVANFNLVRWKSNVYSAEWNTAFRTVSILDGAMEWMVRGSIPNAGTRLFSFQKLPDRLWKPPGFLCRRGKPDRLHRVPEFRMRVVNVLNFVHALMARRGPAVLYCISYRNIHRREEDLNSPGRKGLEDW